MLNDIHGKTDDNVVSQYCPRASGVVLEHEATMLPAELYDPTERPIPPAIRVDIIRELQMEKTRRLLMLWGFRTVIVTISIPAFVMVGAAFFPESVSYQPAKEWMQVIIPIELSILSGAFGYYFGKKQ